MTSNGRPQQSVVVVGQLSPLLGRGLTEVLGEDKSLWLAESGVDDAGLERAITRWRPDVVILDSASVAELSFLSRLRDRHPAVKIVVLAHRPERLYGAELIAAGASCLSTDASAADILAMIRRAAHGEHVLVLKQDLRREGLIGPRTATLTQREREVLEGMRRGCSYGEIADELGIGIETVRTHAAGVRRKLGVSRKADLVGLHEPVWPKPVAVGPGSASEHISKLTRISPEYHP